MVLVSDESTVEKFTQDFNSASVRYGDIKKQLAEDMVGFITPIREKAESIFNDHYYLKQVIDKGREEARKSAQKTIEQVREMIGLNYL